MSSEEEARERVHRYCDIFYPYIGKPGATETLAQQEADLDAYRAAIERRVLAQQPCYRGRGLASPSRTCADMREELCPTCTARQTQETSG